MKNYLLIFILAIGASTLFSQVDTSYIYFSTVDSMYYTVDEVYFDDVNIPPLRDVNKAGADSLSVIDFLTHKVVNRKVKEARGVKHSYENKGLTGVAALLLDFSGESYYKHTARRYENVFAGDYKIWVNRVSYDASMALTPAGNMRLYIPSLTNYTVRILSKNSFEVRNYTPEHVRYSLIRTVNGKKMFLGVDSDNGWKIRSK